ncbi:N-acetylmuramoyl-L-alanine amidase [Inhella sp.]|uniref:N-acetylmuramoyl-L-alanine amidase n=1 Tax=Inhella sp. TaxID=1921806 RepID=UPI0035B0353F
MKRRLLIALGSATWTLPLLAKPDDPRLVAVRVWPARDYTRVTLESDKPLQARHFLTPDGPNRLVLDIEGLDLSPQLKELVAKTQPDDPNIAGVRVGQYLPRVVRIVFDLRQPIAPQVFTLKPVAAYQHRLVLDLYPKQPAADDPLLALIEEREREDARESARESSSPPTSKAESSPSANVASAAAISPATQPEPPKPTPAPLPRLPRHGRMERLVVVALDAGHGGEDPGAIGPTGLREKDVVLAVARMLRERLEEVPGLRVLMTRDGDYFVPLQERVRKARKVGADLFVSIHADAFMRPQARGTSVFVLSDGAATSAAARWMAQRENAADAVGGLNVGAVKDRVVLQTLLDMSTTAQIEDSLKLGADVLGQLGKVGRLHKPRVEQAGFAVLKAPDIPSILVETAFISNPEEEAKLRDSAYRRRLVDAMARGLLRYLARRPALRRDVKPST